MATDLKILHITDIHVSDTPTFGQFLGDPLSGELGWRHPGNQINSLPAAVSRANSDNVDLVAVTGDIINGSSGGTRADHWAEWVSWVDGTHASSDGFNAPVVYALGNWDAGQSTAIYDALFDDVTGIGTILPAGQSNLWWPDTPNVTDDLPCAYTLEVNGFMIIALCNQGSGTVPMDAPGKNGTQTQGQWFNARLDEAEAAGQPTVVLTHLPLRSNDADFSASSGTAQAITDMEAQTIKPIVMGGHLHRDIETIEENGILFIKGRGDVWGVENDDTDRFSHSVITIRPGTVWANGGHQSNVEVVGYGYSGSKTFAQYLAA